MFVADTMTDSFKFQSHEICCVRRVKALASCLHLNSLRFAQLVMKLVMSLRMLQKVYVGPTLNLGAGC